MNDATHIPPGQFDPYFVPAGAQAFRRDVPDAVVRLLPTGHFALETIWKRSS
jgi:hypothetical protein